MTAQVLQPPSEPIEGARAESTRDVTTIGEWVLAVMFLAIVMYAAVKHYWLAGFLGAALFLLHRCGMLLRSVRDELRSF